MKHVVYLGACLVSVTAIANEEVVQDMSDPLAVYTQVGSGVTDKGLNLKVGQTYDTGKDDTAAINIIEVKGFLGEQVGWNDSRDDSVDSLRFRNFSANIANGRARQIDVQYDLKTESGTASYSLIQALPKMGPVSLYPLAGLGASFINASNGEGEQLSGYALPGTFAMVGTYGKLAINDKLWLNYNPMWFTTLSGSDSYVDFGLEGDSSVLKHEVALSYQFTPRFNVRYFANWSQNEDFKDGGHRLEFNYQL
ncbi:hypothetical protein [Photobacterium sp. DNB22_13_2]